MLSDYSITVPSIYAPFRVNVYFLRFHFVAWKFLETLFSFDLFFFLHDFEASPSGTAPIDTS